MMRNKSFCAFILTHGRADNVITYNTLKKGGYTGEIRLVCDDEDEQLPRYKELYGDEVIVFSKDEAKKYTKAMDNFNVRKVITFARNACFILAKNMGIKNFIELDDDYSYFNFRFDKERRYQFNDCTIGRVTCLDDVFDAFVDFLNNTPTAFVAFAQNGDFIGGQNGTFGSKIFMKRKAMNSFFCKAEKPCYFMGTLNEDVISFTKNGNIGVLYLTHNIISLHQGQTQQTAGGITEVYNELGTYTKSFSAVMAMPSCVKVSTVGNENRTKRIHHKINWRYCVPKILSEPKKKKI